LTSIREERKLNSSGLLSPSSIFSLFESMSFFNGLCFSHRIFWVDSYFCEQGPHHLFHFHSAPV
jgi:hypothetical protein